MKRGQTELSFGMIFSIILIICFLAFAFYAINNFLKLQKTMQVGKFHDELQGDIDKMWRASKGSQEYTYRLPSAVELVCIMDYGSTANGKNIKDYQDFKEEYYGKENLFFYPAGSSGKVSAIDIEHIEMDKTTGDDNPACFKVADGKVKLTLKKDFGETLVTIE